MATRKKATPHCAFEPCGLKVHKVLDYCYGCKNHVCPKHDETGIYGEHHLADHTNGSGHVR